jgi:hypothetical protein
MANYPFPRMSNNGQMTDSFNFNTNTSHPLIQSSQEYMYYKKFVSIHSEDRDQLKYPYPADFEIDIPEDLLNVASIRLVDWSFPANYNTFSLLNSNISMSFVINNPYNPNINNVTDTYIQNIFEALFINLNEPIYIYIEEGFYNPQQMVTELTNKFNNAVTLLITSYLTKQINNPTTTPEKKLEYQQTQQQLALNGGYSNFVIVYNNVSQKIWFGNTCDGFILTNESQGLKNTLADNLYCGVKSQSPDFSSWGLPANLGLDRCNVQAISGTSLNNDLSYNLTTYFNIIVPRFYYGDVFPGDNGYWLVPNPSYTNSQVYWIEANYKINLMGPAYMYMELDGQNCIDETVPYNVSPYTLQNSVNNGVANSSFAKIGIPTTPMSQWFDKSSYSYKYYYPPAERMRRFKIKLRYHNGLFVDFGVFNYSFTLEFVLQMPQMLRNSKSQVYPPVGK